MANDKDFQRKVQRISELAADLEKIASPEVRASSKTLVQLVMDLHASGLERIMEMIADSGENGQRTIDEMGHDSLVSSLLVLYGLHPLNFETRVVSAVERMQARVRKAGGEVQLLGVDGDVVRLEIKIAGHSCGSTGKNLRTIVEDALFEAAPDAARLQIDGLDEPAAAGFVPLGKLGGANAMPIMMAES